MDIIVSNRLPVSILERQGGQSVLRQNDGGLVAGLNGVHRASSSIWIGALTASEAERAASLGGEFAKRGLRFVTVPDAEYVRYYEGWCNEALWPLHHYREDTVKLDVSAWEAYVGVNALFAEGILKEVADDDRVWIHDYHLMLLPKMLREMKPNLKIGFFLHIPFPSWETFRILPQRREIVEGLFGADLVGFHTAQYAEYCANAAMELLPDIAREKNDAMDFQHSGRHVRLGKFPMGIDAKNVFDRAHSNECEVLLSKFCESYRGATVILGIDRLDYSKGLPHRILAVGEFFERNPEYVGKVIFIQVAVPTREAVGEYQRIKDEVDRLVGSVNGKFGRAGYVPLHYLYQSILPHEVYAYYRLAALLIVSALRDGLNVVAKEYVAAKGDQEPGVLLLSEFAGSSAELDGAIPIHPWDISGMADAIKQGLSVPIPEQLEMMKSMYSYLLENNNIAWSSKFLGELEEVHAMNR